jgi:hypothetical protein
MGWFVYGKQTLVLFCIPFSTAKRFDACAGPHKGCLPQRPRVLSACGLLLLPPFLPLDFFLSHAHKARTFSLDEALAFVCEEWVWFLLTWR